jgi:hypothetical protein
MPWPILVSPTELAEISKKKYVSPVAIAVIHAWLGESFSQSTPQIDSIHEAC